MSLLDLLQRSAKTPDPLVLCYHAVSSSWRSSLAVSERLLSQHVDVLKRFGYVGVTFSEAERLRRRGGHAHRAAAITFDDGFASVLRAVPILEGAGFPATVFVVTRFAGGSILRWPEVEPAVQADGPELRSLSWKELGGLHERGWEIGSHTVTHPWLTRLDDTALMEELEASRQQIVERLGGCEALAYPFGAADERVADAARRAGYRAACTLSGAQRVNEPYRRPRVGLYPADDGFRARAKLWPTSVRLRRTTLAAVADRSRSRGKPRSRPARGERVVVTGTGSPAALAVVRGLADAGYEPWVAADVRAYAAHSRRAAGVVRVSDPASDAERFAAEVAALAGDLGAAAVFPSDLRSLRALSGEEHLFREETALAVPSPATVRRAREALEPHALADPGVPTTPTALHRAGEPVSSEITFPAIVTPATGPAGVGVARTAAELEELATAAPGGVVVRSRVDGTLEAIVGVAWEGELLSAGMQVVRRQWPPEYGAVAFGLSVEPDPALVALARRIAERLAWSGLLQVRFVRTPAGRLLLDVEPCAYGSLQLAIAAGLNLPAIYVDRLLDRPPRTGTWRAGVAFRSEELDARAILHMLRRDPLGALRALAPRRRTAHSLFALRDPLPFLAIAARAAGSGAGRRHPRGSRTNALTPGPGARASSSR